MALIDQFDEMRARNAKNIKDVPGSSEGGQGVYILYDGSAPVNVGKGNIRQRLRRSDTSNRRGNSWNYFSWYIIKDKNLIHDVEVLLIRILPLYLRYLTRQTGRFLGVSSTGQQPVNRIPRCIAPPKFMRPSR
jgi:hypothetical protein